MAVKISSRGKKGAMGLLALEEEMTSGEENNYGKRNPESLFGPSREFDIVKPVGEERVDFEGEIDELQEAIESLNGVSCALEKIHTELGDARQDVADPSLVNITDFVVTTLSHSVAIPYERRDRVTLENMEQDQDGQLRISQEGIKKQLGKVWDALIRAMKRVMEFIKEFFRRAWGALFGDKKEHKDHVKEIEKAQKKHDFTKVEGNQQKLKPVVVEKSTHLRGLWVDKEGRISHATELYGHLRDVQAMLVEIIVTGTTILAKDGQEVVDLFYSVKKSDNPEETLTEVASKVVDVAEKTHNHLYDAMARLPQDFIIGGTKVTPTSPNFRYMKVGSNTPNAVGPFNIEKTAPDVESVRGSEMATVGIDRIKEIADMNQSIVNEIDKFNNSKAFTAANKVIEKMDLVVSEMMKMKKIPDDIEPFQALVLTYQYYVGGFNKIAALANRLDRVVNAAKFYSDQALENITDAIEKHQEMS